MRQKNVIYENRKKTTVFSPIAAPLWLVFLFGLIDINLHFTYTNTITTQKQEFKMDIIITVLVGAIFLIALGYCIKMLSNVFAFIFALVLSWILIPQENRAFFFADICDRMFKGKK